MFDVKILDCTLRDGGYYNKWDFPRDIINRYLEAMSAAGVDIVELGLRSLINKGFKGAAGYTSEQFLNSLEIPRSLSVAVMVNASELVGDSNLLVKLEQLFPKPAAESKVDIVRIACHVHEFEETLPASTWLKSRGYTVGFNLMQVADREQSEIEALAAAASEFDLDVLYFADSMGSMGPAQCETIITWLRKHWKGALGIHTHDNMGLALSNTLKAMNCGVSWLDATVTGMGRGPGNARTEELAIEISEKRDQTVNLVPLMGIIRQYFQPLKNECGWGTNPYYYLAGKYGIHPTYIQEMLSDPRYDEEDILAVIGHLRLEGGKRFTFDTLDAARHFYHGDPAGTWTPATEFSNREVLLLGTGPGVASHKEALEAYIRAKSPLVIALNTQASIAAELIDFRIACHPVRLLADCEEHTRLPQPLITPFSMLPDDVREALSGKEVRDFGLQVRHRTFEFNSNYCVAPSSLVMAYAFSVITSGKGSRILLAGFDGYAGEDKRNEEMNTIVKQYQQSENSIPLIAITSSKYDVENISVYGLV